MKYRFIKLRSLWRLLWAKDWIVYTDTSAIGWARDESADTLVGKQITVMMGHNE